MDIPVISLIGGIGSGKSAISQELAKRYAVQVINADEVGHEVLHEPTVIQQLQESFGSEIINGEGQAVRPRIAALVFGETPEHRTNLKRLEDIVHPHIRSRVDHLIQQSIRSGSYDLIILDAALLLEAGWDQVCDLVFFVDVSEEIRLQRVTQNRNWSEEEFRKREFNQLSLVDKKTRAEYTIENNDDLSSAVDQLETYLKQHFQVNL
ncbi:Dephospho-CoA kinase [Polystyrenella longa]|uniref:Dephospho-CoA kinase n=1 Tax=Polystyrenella longa TaxID=2528007 RepID=A0A518CQM1_9PLAN|nr:dephospho-CoA kinase [Polystyrenella longa]QDU81526.1 Dephospho-CoA kinase [Polystyrenella longa]